MSGARAAFDPDLADEVAAFLRANPHFLADNPELYHVLLPPVRVHGEALADHMAAMIRAERSNSARVAAQTDGMVVAGRAAAGMTERVQEAVLSLMAAHDPLEWVEAELPGLLGLDAAALCVERYLPGTRRVPTGTVSRMLGGRDVVFRERPADAALFHAEAAPLARNDALVRVPGQPALLALAARSRALLNREQGMGALAFLGRARAAALRLAGRGRRRAPPFSTGWRGSGAPAR
jgi:uncharacterized protein YigA (DUF484 family)